MKLLSLAVCSFLITSGALATVTMNEEQTRAYDERSDIRNGFKPKPKVIYRDRVIYKDRLAPSSPMIQREEAAPARRMHPHNHVRNRKPMKRAEGDQTIHSGSTEQRYNAHDKSGNRGK